MHEPVGPGWLVWLETTGVAVAMRSWPWLYPLVEVAHIAGLAVLVGGAALFDLRLLGLAKALPLEPLGRHLIGWARLSLLAIVPSGLLMFSAHATELSVNPAFRLKLALLLAAALNAAVFHRFSARKLHEWEGERRIPLAVRASACASLLCWTGVIACGRLIAYL